MDCRPVTVSRDITRQYHCVQVARLLVSASGWLVAAVQPVSTATLPNLGSVPSCIRYCAASSLGAVTGCHCSGWDAVHETVGSFPEPPESYWSGSRTRPGAGGPAGST